MEGLGSIEGGVVYKLFSGMSRFGHGYQLCGFLWGFRLGVVCLLRVLALVYGPWV